MYLFFDTETTGLPKNWKAPVTEVDNWPRLVELAWILTDAEGESLEEVRAVLKPEGFRIPAEAAKVHGISHDQAVSEGEDLGEVLESFSAAVRKTRFLVGHNIFFDEKIVGAEFIRKEVEHVLWERESICTKMESTDFCAIPGKYGHKWPTLSELHEKVFGEKFEGAHTALEDVRATMRCFFALKKQGVV